MSILVGLVRVSTDKQNTARQHNALEPICWKVFEEKASGKLATKDRPVLLEAISQVPPEECSPSTKSTDSDATSSKASSS